MLVRETCTILIDSVASRFCSPSGILSKCPSSLVIYANICWLTGRLKATIVPECDVAEHHPANSGNKKQHMKEFSHIWATLFGKFALSKHLLFNKFSTIFWTTRHLLAQFNTVYLCTAIRTHSAALTLAHTPIKTVVSSPTITNNNMKNIVSFRLIPCANKHRCDEQRGWKRYFISSVC